MAAARNWGVSAAARPWKSSGAGEWGRAGHTTKRGPQAGGLRLQAELCQAVEYGQQDIPDMASSISCRAACMYCLLWI